MRSCALDGGLGLGSHVQIAVQRAVAGQPTRPSHASPGSITPFPHPAGTPSVVVVVVVAGVLVVVAGMLEVVAAVLDGLAMVVVVVVVSAGNVVLVTTTRRCAVNSTRCTCFARSAPVHHLACRSRDPRDDHDPTPGCRTPSSGRSTG